eukprot:CAMPEP_0183328064 /NCGR_PEP_ID=MMETSP0160_2-20130417/84089_1 /TAXON_ID=2839 ORGANISM="Odontella Sinensis, Strain Grunow 1884" /NCGR_SAMPLE_ID=MMETSP0160_2 /ASSEMBLY_ACC=CAM_ASM_000250 /LENGTH=338 /DNA_ID=CAMNT_0025496221 /DNA_START=55 /DNA_END=1071 /DNA_ORIENTATION=+
MTPFIRSSALLLVILGSAGAFSVAPPTRSASPATHAAAAVRPPAFGLNRFPSSALVPRTPFSSSALFMGWGPDPIWSPGTVTSNVPACPSGSCVSISVAVTGDEAAQYSLPGQYVQVRPRGDEDAKPIFLAIASPPSAAAEGEEADAAAGPESETFEFLIKKTETNGWITDYLDTPLDVSQPLGSGFPITDNLDGFKYDFPTQNVLLFATGSGIAPVRSAIESGALNVGVPGSGGRTARLYYGVRTPEDMPYAERFDLWEGMGVEVVPVVSRPEECDAPEGQVWPGRTGYVQNALEEDGVAIPRNSGAVLCGQGGMTEAVTEILTKAGVFEGRVLKNF